MNHRTERKIQSHAAPGRYQDRRSAHEQHQWERQQQSPALRKKSPMPRPYEREGYTSTTSIAFRTSDRHLRPRRMRQRGSESADRSSSPARRAQKQILPRIRFQKWCAGLGSELDAEESKRRLTLRISDAPPTIHFRHFIYTAIAAFGCYAAMHTF